MMREKRGDTLGISFFAKIGIAVICLFFLLYVLNVIYGYFTGEKNKNNAERYLTDLRDVMDKAKKTGNLEVVYLEGVRDWFVFVVDAKDNKENVWCPGQKYCLCMCPVPLTHESCIKSKIGVCIELEGPAWGRWWGKDNIKLGVHIQKAFTPITVQYYDASDRKYVEGGSPPNWKNFWEFYDFDIKEDFVNNRNDVIPVENTGENKDGFLFKYTYTDWGPLESVKTGEKTEVDLAIFKDRTLLINEKYDNLVYSVYDVAESFYNAGESQNVNPMIVMSILLGKYGLFEREIDMSRLISMSENGEEIQIKEPTDLDEIGKSYWRDVWILRQIYGDVQSDAASLLGSTKTGVNCEVVSVPGNIGQDSSKTLEENKIELVNAIKGTSSAIGKCMAATLKTGYDEKAEEERWTETWPLGDAGEMKPTSKTNAVIYWYLNGGKEPARTDLVNAAKIWKFYNLYTK